jgi:uncharacterized damage-inducible protein DinB
LRFSEVDIFKFPIGDFVPILEPTNEERIDLINQIPQISRFLRDILKNLSFEQLQTPYRPGGWTIQQVVHHMADNDMNAYIRLKRALTENEPQTSSYREDLWADLHDYKLVPSEISLSLLEALHRRLFVLLEGINSEDFCRRFHTILLGEITVDTALQRFVWHNRHHTAQIKSIIDRMGW